MGFLGFKEKLHSLGSLLCGNVSDRTRRWFPNPKVRGVLAGVLIFLGIVTAATAYIVETSWVEITIYLSGEQSCFNVTRYDFYSIVYDQYGTAIPVHNGHIIHRSPCG